MATIDSRLLEPNGESEIAENFDRILALIDALSDSLGADDEAATVKGRIAALETAVGGADAGLVADVATLKETVGDGESGLVYDVDDIQSILEENDIGHVEENTNDNE